MIIKQAIITNPGRVSIAGPALDGRRIVAIIPSMLSIRGLTLSRPMVLAPMSGISDLPYRMLNRSFGCGFAFMEMLNIRSLCANTKKTRRMLVTDPADRPLGIQLIGHQPDYIPRAIEVLKESGIEFDLLDFNAACPAKKLALKGAGAGMLRTPSALEAAVRLLVRHSAAPVTVKIRTGWDRHDRNAVEIARRCQDAGCHALFVHGRTRDQGYRGGVDYGSIREVKRAVRIPVIGSGDIWSADSARRMLERTGCDAVAVARGALGNPWIIPELAAMFDAGQPPPRPGPAEVAAVVLRHAAGNVRVYGEPIGVMRLRKHLGWYLKGFPGTRSLRARAFKVSTYEELKLFLENLLKR